jgi:hypothetical protein
MRFSPSRWLTCCVRFVHTFERDGVGKPRRPSAHRHEPPSVGEAFPWRTTRTAAFITSFGA